LPSKSTLLLQQQYLLGTRRISRVRKKATPLLPLRKLRAKRWCKSLVTPALAAVAAAAAAAAVVVAETAVEEKQRP
jgi:hypothetical protein